MKSWQAVCAAHLRSPVTITFGAKACEFVTLFGLATLVPRLLGPTDFGQFALALSIVAIGSLMLSFGSFGLIVRFVPSVGRAERPALARSLAVRLIAWRALQVTVVTLVAVILIIGFPNAFPLVTTTLIVAALALDVGATLAFQVVLALGRTNLWSFRYPIQNALLIIFAVSLGTAAGRSGAIGAVTAASGAALVLGTIVVAAPLWRAQKGFPIPAGARRYGIYTAIGSFFVFVYQRGGVVAVAGLNGSSVEIGYAGLAVGVAIAGTSAVGQAFAVQLPGLVERAGTDSEAAEAGARRLARNVQFILLPCTLASAVALDALVTTIVGAEYRDATSALVPALALIPLAPLLGLGGQIAALRLQQERRLVAAAAGAAAFLIVAIATVPVWGAAGGTFALLAATATGAVTFALVLPGALTPALIATGFGGAALVLAAGSLF